MTENYKKWCENNLMALGVEETSNVITVGEFGKLLYIQPKDGKIIGEDFGFILDDDEFNVLDKGEVNYILFEFGSQFYYSPIKKDKNEYNEVIFKPEFNDYRYVGKSKDSDFIEFNHLGIHSEYDMLDGSGNAELWVKKGEFLGCKYLGICDKNTLAGTLPFQTACEKHGIKSIIGETVSVAVNYDESKEVQEVFDLKLFVLNYEGWKNLLLINKSINVDYNKFVIDDFLYSHGKGLACVIAKESEFNFYKGDKKRTNELLSIYKKSFDEVFYQIDTVEYVSQSLFRKHLENIDNYLCNYSKQIKPLLINDSYYVDSDESELKGMLNKISGKVLPEGKNQFFKSGKQTIYAYEEWVMNVDKLLWSVIKGIENANWLVKLRIDFRIKTGERKLPKFETDDVETVFFQEVKKGFDFRFGKLPKKEQEKYLKQLEIECKVIVPNGLCDYFMILWDIINWCHKNNISTGPGRGSVCGSLVAYCLHITDVDPLKYGLLFERFLNEIRVKVEKVWELEMENGKKFRIKKGTKLPTTDGEFIDICKETDLSEIDIDVKKLMPLCIN